MDEIKGQVRIKLALRLKEKFVITSMTSLKFVVGAWLVIARGTIDVVYSLIDTPEALLESPPQTDSPDVAASGVKLTLN